MTMILAHFLHQGLTVGEEQHAGGSRPDSSRFQCIFNMLEVIKIILNELF